MDHDFKLRMVEGSLALAWCSASRCKLQYKLQCKLQRKLCGPPSCGSICRPRADRGECTCAARATCAA
eukprot:15431148-Alexandrium_andersonii.AAC.1